MTMIYIATLLIVLLTFSILLILHNDNKNRIQFEIKIQSLEQTIVSLTKNLEIQTQKVKISNDLKMNIRQNNQQLSEQIVDLNLGLMEELFEKKKM